VYTVGEAAQVVGLTRQAIVKAIKSGRLSASRGEGGRWAIDPAELSRVYEVARQPTTTSLRSLSPVVPVDESLLRAELDKWRLLATEREETIRDLRQQRDRAQAALDAAEARLDRLLLTDQRLATPAASPPRRRWWRWR
jgi:excisionase family DNA binding protein